MSKITRALISVSDKTGLVDFAKALDGFGVEMLSTGGTAKLLRDAGLRVVQVSDYTGQPEILDGRVKTLHPKVHGGLLAVRDNAEHQKQLAAQGFGPIDMVVVNLYPFEATVAKPAASFDEAIENIDIGGPAMIRSVAKNHAFVTVIVDPDDYARRRRRGRRGDESRARQEGLPADVALRRRDRRLSGVSDRRGRQAAALRRDPARRAR